MNDGLRIINRGAQLASEDEIERWKTAGPEKCFVGLCTNTVYRAHRCRRHYGIRRRSEA